jgi:hypothetical protein
MLKCIREGNSEVQHPKEKKQEKSKTNMKRMADFTQNVM